MSIKIYLEETGGKKIYVRPEFGEGVYLYPGEIKKLGLKEGDCVDQQELERFRTEYAIPRAKKRAMALLVKKDYTEGELRDKLCKSVNDSRSVEEALRYVLAHGYVDDMQYARDYISSKKGKKSFRQIQMELTRKGISSQMLTLAFEEAGEQDAADLLPLVKRYMRKFSQWDEAALRKTCAHFYRKGYAAASVRQAMEALEMEESMPCDDI